MANKASKPTNAPLAVKAWINHPRQRCFNVTVLFGCCMFKGLLSYIPVNRKPIKKWAHMPALTKKTTT